MRTLSLQGAHVGEGGAFSFSANRSSKNTLRSKLDDSNCLTSSAHLSISNYRSVFVKGNLRLFQQFCARGGFFAQLWRGLAALALSVATTAFAGEPTSEPLLRL